MMTFYSSKGVGRLMFGSPTLSISSTLSTVLLLILGSTNSLHAQCSFDGGTDVATVETFDTSTVQSYSAPYDVFSSAFGSIVDVTTSATIEICFWGDMDENNETWSVNISGIVSTTGDFGFVPTSSSPVCQTYAIPAATLESDLSDGDIDITYNNFGAGWEFGDGFNAFVNAVSFDYDVDVAITEPDDQCQDGGDITFAGFPTDGTETGDVGTLEIFPATTAFNSSTGVLDVSEVEPGDYTVEYFYEANGCTYEASTDFTIFETPRANLSGESMQCDLAGDSVDLQILFEDVSDIEGIFSIAATSPNTATITQDRYLQIPDGGGCYTIRYEVEDTTSCGNGPYFDETFLFVTTRPEPNFSISGDVSPYDSNGEDAMITIADLSTGPNQELTVSGGSFDSMSINFGDVSLPAPQSAGSITYEICLTETNDMPADCDTLLGANVTLCREEFCQTFTVFNDGIGDTPFPSECVPGANAPDACVVSTRPDFTIECSYLDINFPDVVTATVDVNSDIILCSEDSVCFDWLGSITLFGDDIADSDVKLTDISDEADKACDVISFEFCVPIPAVQNPCFDPLPFGNVIESACNDPLGQFISTALAGILGGDGGGGIIVADTDGDGAFDMIVDTYSFPDSGDDLCVPNNVEGPNGAISIRNVVTWPRQPNSVCGVVVEDQINLLNILPIDAIPIIGDVVEAILEAASCDVPLDFSDVQTQQVSVLNTTPPSFANCGETGYQFSEDGVCDTEANWSIPVVFDGCYDSTLPYIGRTAGTDDSFFNGSAPDIVTVDGSGLYQTGGPIPGSDLPPGTYTVTYTAYSCTGQEETCSFPVVVTSGDPVLACPDSTFIKTDADDCSTVVTGINPRQGVSCATIINYDIGFADGSTASTNTPFSTDNLGTHNDASGQIFPIGESVVTYTMLVDINGDGDVDDENETQTCSFTVNVVDTQRPTASCVDAFVQLDNTGSATVFAEDQNDGSPFVNGGSFDNCDDDLEILIAKAGEDFAASATFDCSETGGQLVTLQATDDVGNVSTCLAQIEVRDFFDGIQLQLDIPELCLENVNPNQVDFSNYLNITLPDGTVLGHDEVENSTFLGDAVGAFGITAFAPAPGTTSIDPGSVSYDGEYTLGEGTGYITVSYVLALPGADIPQNGNAALGGCFQVVHETFEVRQPLDMESPECECIVQNDRIVDLDTITGGLEPYQIQYSGVQLDFDSDGIADDVDGEFIYEGSKTGSSGVETVFDIGNFNEDLGNLLVDYTQPTWSFTVVDARGCELFRSGSCDNDDETGTPEILCEDLGPVSLFTEDMVCEAQYEWEHPLPTDNCDVILYTYTITNPDGSIAGPFDITALLNPDITNPLPDQFFGEYDFEHDSPTNNVSTVTYYAEDAVGNFTQCSFEVTVTDDDAPRFINCPEPAVIVDAPEMWCAAFANYSLPLAEDNCDIPVVTQIDTTGLTSGDLYPVGITINTFQATDATGNTDTCNVKIIVNDFHTPPTLECPEDVIEQTNDPGDCGAEVGDIAPSGIDDNCIDNLSIVYRITNEEGEEVASGFDDASGNFFELGTSTVEYSVQDMPLLLITELTHDLGNAVDGTLPIPDFAAPNPPTADYLEITNFNRASMDISCLMIERQSASGSEIYAVPTFTILEPGETLTLHFGDGTDVYAENFFNVPGAADLDSSEPAAYIVSLSRSILDIVVMNGFDISSLSPPEYNLGGLAITDYWSGDIGPVNGGGIVRTTVWDTDTADDFAPGEACLPTTIGTLNPGLAQPTPNGTQTAIQAQPTVRVECSFTVEVIDEEPAVCGLYSDFNDYIGGPVTIEFGDCIETTIPVSDVYDIADVNLSLQGLAGDLGNLAITLISPEGTAIELADGVCAGTDAIEFTLDGDFGPIIGGACGTLNNGGQLVMPVGNIEAFNGEAVNGDWILQIGHNGQQSTVAAQIQSFILFISARDAYPDFSVTLENDLGFCGAEYSWFHPILFDNCPGGSLLQEIIFFGAEGTETQLIETLPIFPENTETDFFFSVGETLVRYTLTDAAGNVSVCSFLVTVLDTEDPTLTCPEDITIQLDGGECDVIYIPVFPVDYTYDDNCGVVEVIPDPDWSIPLPIGVNPVNLTVRDSSGNDTTCTYVVTVLEYVPDPPQMVCISQLNVHLDDEDCEQEIIPEMVLAGDEYFCFDNYELTLFFEDEDGNLDTLPNNILGVDQIGETVTYNVFDPRNEISCWGTIDVGFFEEPDFICPADTSVSCNAFTDPSFLGEPILTGCALAGANVSFVDSLFRFEQCDDPRAILTRTWTVEDDYGNSGSCVQTITIEAFDLMDVIFPTDFDDVSAPAISCFAASNDPTLTDPVNTGFPTVSEGGNIFQTNFCSASFLFTDEVYDICAGSFEILRTWKVRNTCQPFIPGVNPREHVQIIRVLDQENPVLDCPENDTISTGPFDCNGVYIVPAPEVVESCSDFTYNVVTTGGTLIQEADGSFVIADLELGTYTIRYEVEDECGRFSECSYQLTVDDLVSATAICENGLNISLDGNGFANIAAEDIDGGSDDLCGNVELEVRRLFNFDATNCELLDSPFFGTWGESIPVNCCDIDSLVTIELRVTDEEGNSSVCWTDVLIEDKLPPLCLPPNSLQVTCLEVEGELPDNLNDAFDQDPDGTAALLDQLFGEATAADNCGGAIIEQSVIDTRTTCGSGTIFRTFVAVDEQGLSSTAPCTQQVIVAPVHDYTITFPADRSSNECVEPEFEGLLIDENGCDLFTTNISVDTFEATADECYKLRLTYEIINWCEYTTEEDPYIIPRDADGDDVLEEETFLHVLPNGIGGIDDDVALLDNDANRNNGFISTLDLHEVTPGQVFGASTQPYGTDESRGSFLYRQFIAVYDETPPVLTLPELEPFEDLDGNCTEVVEIDFMLVDECISVDDYVTSAELDAFFSDQDGDEILTLADFVPSNIVELSPSISNNGDSTFTISFENELPLGRHALRILASDGCGNSTVGLIIFEIVDAKAPTPVCINGLTVTLMPDGNGGGMAELWASEYVVSIVDDCTEPVGFAIYHPDDFDALDNGTLEPSVQDTGLELRCEDFGQLLVRIYAIDAAGNADYCETTLNVQVFMPNICSDIDDANILGTVENTADEPVPNVEMTISDGGNMNNTVYTNQNGDYTFTGLELGDDYTISPGLDMPVDVASAITTFDILMINRHILGVDEFTNPYQYHIADVNGDEVINVIDAVHIRMVIMGQEENYIAGPTWQFVDRDYAFSDDPSEWLSENLPSVINFNDLTGDILNADFYALEMGNVSSAQFANGLVEEVEARSSVALITDELDLTPGEEYSIGFRASDLYGFQGTLEFAPGLELIDLEYGQLQAGHVNLDLISEGLMSFSYEKVDGIGENGPLFSLRIRSSLQASLSDLLSITNRITKSEAYPLNGGLANLGIDFVQSNDVGIAFLLEQNMPNPFQDFTQIAFQLPVTAKATLVIEDAIGRVIMIREIDGNAGFNQVGIYSEELNGAKGVLTYRLTQGDNMASRRMISN